MSRLNISGLSKIMLVTLLCCLVSVIALGVTSVYGSETETATLDAVEIKDDSAESSAEITLEDVQKSREIDKNRVYGLIGLWAVIALCVYLINMQRKEDERLYLEGYYDKEEH